MQISDNIAVSSRHHAAYAGKGFIAAILIAVSIEALLLLFKAALGEGEHLVEAVWMMLAAVGLLVGLGLYVYLGAKAEALLLGSRRR